MMHIGDNIRTDKMFADILNIPFFLTNSSDFSNLWGDRLSEYKTTSATFLIYKNQLLLQLRDNKPNISSPNCWGLFGGSLNTNEKPEHGLIREVYEETGILINEVDHQIKHFKTVVHCDFETKEGMIENIYFIECNRFNLKEVKLNKGQDLCLAKLTELRNAKDIYSIQTQCYHHLPLLIKSLANDYVKSA